MVKWFLIVLWTTGAGAGNSITSEHIEMQSEEACRAAGDLLMKTDVRRSHPAIPQWWWCVPDRIVDTE